MSEEQNSNRIEIDAIANESLAMVDYLRQRNMVLSSEIVRMKRHIGAQDAEIERLREDAMPEYPEPEA